MSFILYPFAWLLRLLYDLFNNYGLALILFSLIIKLILFPFSARSKRGTMKTSRLQPKLKDLEKRFAGNKEKYNEEVQKLYKDNDVNMMGGCIWSLIPFPILIGLYSVIRKPLTYMMNLTVDQIAAAGGVLTGLGYAAVNANSSYGEIELAQKIFENFDAVKAVVPQISRLDFSFMGINLSSIPDYKFLFGGTFTWQAFALFLIPVISALLSWVSTKVAMMGSGAKEQETMKGMTLMAPVMSLWIGFIMPAGLGIYWIATSVFTMIQDYFLAKYYTKVLDKEDAERLERQRVLEEERERKRLEYERLKAENANKRNINTSKKKVQKVERIESEKKGAEYEKKKLAEKGIVPEPRKVDSDRPFARGRAFDASRNIESAEAVNEASMVVEEDPAVVAARAAEEAARKDKEAFEKFLATGKIEEAEDFDSDEETSDGTPSDGDVDGLAGKE